MINTTETLIALYDIALQSGSDSTFYRNVHSYIDLIRKTPSLSKIIDDSEKEYRKNHNHIWSEELQTEDEADEKEERTIRLERFNLFASDFAWLEARIYFPIEDYKQIDAPDHEQDPVALLMLKGIDVLSNKHLEIKNISFNEKQLKLYNRWYEGKRTMYEDTLKRFHADFLLTLNQLKDITIKPQIVFDKENSVLKIDGKEVRIRQKNDKPNSHYVLEYIFENGEGLKAQCFYSDIIEAKFPNENVNNMSVYRACNDINKKVSEQAKVSNFLIVKSGKSGYTQINPDYL